MSCSTREFGDMIETLADSCVQPREIYSVTVFKGRENSNPIMVFYVS